MKIKKVAEVYETSDVNEANKLLQSTDYVFNGTYVNNKMIYCFSKIIEVELNL